MSATSTPRFPLREPLLRVQVSNGPSPAGSPRLVPGSPRSGWIVSRKVVGFIVTLLAGLVFCTFIYTTVSFYSVYGDSSSSTAVPSSSSSSASASSASTAVPSSALAATRPGPDDRTRAPSRQARQDAKVFQRCQHDPKAKLPDLKKVYSWRARGRRAHDGISVLTQLSVERLSMLRAQCRVWPAELNAVVYVPLMKDFGAISADVPALNGTSLTDIAHLVDQFYQDLQSDPSGHCRLNMELVVEEFDDWEDPTWSLYPTNSLRNRALTMAKSEAVLSLDVDFLPSQEIVSMFNGRAYEDLMRVLDQKTAYVLPAFETSNSGTQGVLLANKVATEGKEAMLSAFSGGDAVGFQVEQYYAGHGPDDFPRWASAGEPYPIEYAKGYEPYVLMARRFVPWYDERMRGYSRNKIVQVNLLAEQLGVKLLGHHRAFVVHSPHPKASNFKATKTSGQWETLLDLYIHIRRDISLGEFVPVVGFAENKKLCGATVSAADLRARIRKKLTAKRAKREAQKEAKLRKQAAGG